MCYSANLKEANSFIPVNGFEWDSDLVGTSKWDQPFQGNTVALRCKNPPITSVSALLMVLNCVYIYVHACVCVHVNLHMSVARDVYLHVLIFHTKFAYNSFTEVFFTKTYLIHLCCDCTRSFAERSVKEEGQNKGCAICE